MTRHNLTELLKVIRDLVMRNRPCYRDYLGNGQYKTKLLPEYLLPAFLRKNVVATKTEVRSAAAKATTAADAAQTTADNAQTTANAAQSAANAAQATASAKFQLMRQTTVKTTATIGTVSNLEGSAPVSVKGLNIAVGSTI